MSNGITKHCPVCNEPMSFSGHADYYDRSSKYKTSIYYCNGCDIFYRDVDSAKMVDHYYAASYVQEQNEERFFNSRIKFLDYMLSLVCKYGKKQSRDDKGEFSLLDFGSSYGHLLDLAKDKGVQPVGIELNEDLIASCREKGLTVYKQLNDVSKKVDVVTMIDSLYCVPNCKAILNDIKGVLKPDGILLVRITNRNLYAKFLKKYIHKGDLSAIGDATISYSFKGIKKLLVLTGFKVIKVIPDYGRGKRLGFKKYLYYRFSYILTLLTGKRIVLTPGIIIVAKMEESY